MNLPPKPTRTKSSKRKQTLTALLAGFIAGYLTRMAQRAHTSRSRAFIAGVLDELRGDAKS